MRVPVLRACYILHRSQSSRAKVRYPRVGKSMEKCLAASERCFTRLTGAGYVYARRMSERISNRWTEIESQTETKRDMHKDAGSDDMDSGFVVAYLL